MKPVPCKGQLTAWKDDRGFGFIKPEGGGKDVFLHISTLKGAARRPKVGDIIFYERAIAADGKVRAVSASIQGVVVNRPLITQRQPRRQSRQGSSLVASIIGFVILAGVGLSEMQSPPRRSISPVTSSSESPSSVTPVLRAECRIKGNISHNNGYKLYHLPGMEDYKSTIIDPDRGEMWFCSESEAISAGWRKAPK